MLDRRAMGKSVQSNVEHTKIMSLLSEQGLAPRSAPDNRTPSDRFDHTLLLKALCGVRADRQVERGGLVGAAKYEFKVSLC